jgi:hypothetical protein
MRLIAVLGVLTILAAVNTLSAEAAKVHHRKPRPVVLRPSQPVDPRFPPVLQDQTPSYDDPSKLGSG